MDIDPPSRDMRIERLKVSKTGNRLRTYLKGHTLICFLVLLLIAPVTLMIADAAEGCGG